MTLNAMTYNTNTKPSISRIRDIEWYTRKKIELLHHQAFTMNKMFPDATSLMLSTICRLKILSVV